ncbi:hypothetical protein PspCFBP13506_03415 [Pseudomonas sp. CFBP13506]|nr:hypothetical protein PspCFBP13506_03415 [Pseudomonas sp. CFBP13506]
MGQLQAGIFAKDQGVRRGRPIHHAVPAALAMNDHDARDIAIVLHGVPYQMHHAQLQHVLVFPQILRRSRGHRQGEQALGGHTQPLSRR